MKNFFVPFLILIAFITISLCVEGINVSDYTFPESQGTTENFLFYRGQKCGKVTAGEYIRREGQYINAYARSAVHMWASGLKEADGTIANVVEYRADGKVKGTGNTTFISDGTPPMTSQYTDPSSNRVVYSSDYVAYGGGTRTNVSYIKQIALANQERSLYISGTGRAQRYIEWDDTPANAPWYLNPWAWAQGRVLNQSDNPQPKNIVSESKSAIEQGLVSGNTDSPPSTTTFACGVHSGTSSESGDHAWGTAPCGDDTHVGYLCQITGSDHEWVSESCPSSHARYECDGSDHSLQASCSSTDSNGNYCTVTSFYACDSHTHSYPSSPPTPTTPTPPPSPTTVACGAAGWTGCTVRSSDGNACRVDPCGSGCGNYYWSCNPSAVSWHKTSRTCKRAACGASYTNCTRGNGTCSNGAYTYHKQ